MDTSRFSFPGRKRAIWAAVAATALPAGFARAVSTHAHAHAHDSKAVIERVSNDSGVFSAHSNASATVQGVHSHAWADASVGFFHIDKSAGGHAWFQDGNSPKHFWWHAWANSGAFVIDGPAGVVADIRLLLPASGKVTDPGMPNPDDPDEPKPPIPGPWPPSQGLMVDSFFDIFVDVNVDLELDGVKHSLFSGQATFGGANGEKPGLEARGDLQNAFSLSETAEGLNVAVLNQDVMPTQKVARMPTGRIVESLMNIRGALNAPPTDPVPEPKPIDNEAARGGAMSFVAQMMLLNSTGEFKLRALPQGDATGDSKVDAADLILASPRFNKGPSAAMWQEGDWDQDDDVDANDLISASPYFNKGPILLPSGPAIQAALPGASGDGHPSLMYDPATGEFTLDPDGVAGIDSFVIESVAGIFTGDAALMPGVSFFTTDTDTMVAQNFFAPALPLAGHKLGNIASPGLSEAILGGDLTITFGVSGSPNIEGDLVVVPEPGLLLPVATAGLFALRRRRAA